MVYFKSHQFGYDEDGDDDDGNGRHLSSPRQVLIVLTYIILSLKHSMRWVLSLSLFYR